MSKWQIIAGDCRDVMREMEAESIDAIVEDPPYGIHFMNKKWDQFGNWTGKRLINQGGGATTPALEAGRYDRKRDPEYQQFMFKIATELLRIAKPGAHLISFGSPRTYHRLTCALDDAGWEIRDCLMWLFGAGFPKSHNVAAGIDKSYGYPKRGKAIPTASTYQASDVERENKLVSNPVEEYIPRCADSMEHDGEGTALKPAWEPIILARKPFKGTVAANVLKYGTGALNIDGCRIEGNYETRDRDTDGGKSMFATGAGGGAFVPASGRWPANLVLDERAAEMLDEQSGESTSKQGKPRAGSPGNGWGMQTTGAEYLDTGGASRFFYTSKAGKTEREEGLDGNTQTVNDGRDKPADNPYQRGKTERRNLHPTVKPLDLMRWLVRLVTPGGGTVLDPFCGSGTTIMAARIERFSGIGIDIDESSVEIARKRVAYAGEIAGDATIEDAETMGNRHTQLGLKL